MKDLVARILSQYLTVRVRGKTYQIRQNVPWELRLEAQALQDNIIDQYRFDKFIRRVQVEPILERLGFAISSLKPLQERIKTLKQDLYKKYPDLFSQRPIRNELRGAKKELNGLLQEIAMLDTHTLEFYAERMGTFHILSKSISRIKSPSYQLIESLYWGILRQQVNMESIRGIARTDWWRTYWTVKKSAAFRYDPLTDEQLTLSSYSRMYDNVYRHHEAPPQPVIDDDDMLDGWLFLQQQPKKKDPSYGHKIDSSKEIFVMVKDQEHANSIYEMNEPEQKAVQRVRAKQLQQHGTLNFGQFADTQRNLQHATR